MTRAMVNVNDVLIHLATVRVYVTSRHGYALARPLNREIQRKKPEAGEWTTSIIKYNTVLIYARSLLKRRFH